MLVAGRVSLIDVDVTNQSNPIISVVLPAFNAEKYLCEAIDSILVQTLNDFELIIINDGSTDGTLAILEEYKKNDRRVKLISRENRGLVVSLNEGISLARGKWIARMDADDISHPERFAKQVALLEAEDADICGCHWFVINETGKLIEAKLVPLSRDTFIIYLACTVPFAHGSVMMRSSFINQHGLGYGGVKFAEDYDLWVRFFEKGAVFSNVNEFLFSYRETESSLSKQLSKQNAKDSNRLRKIFVRKNRVACIQALRESMKRYSSLSQAERVYVLLASYVASINLKSAILITVARKSSSRSIGTALLYWWRGI